MLTRAAGWQHAGVLRRKISLQELRAGNMGLQELRAGSSQGFSDPKCAYKSCGLAARAGGFETQHGLIRAAGWQPAGVTRAAGWQPAGV